MRGKSLRAAAIILAVMLVLVLAVVPAYAQSGTVTNNQGSNGFGTNVWHTLQAGQHDEWVLLYTGGDNTTATVELGTDSNNAVKFDVYTDQQWVSRASDSTIIPVGRGTQTTSRNTEDNTVTMLNNGDLTWQIHNTAGNKFHFDVYSTSNQAVRYWINVTGDANGGFSLNRGNNVQFANTNTNNGTNANAGAVASATTSTTNRSTGSASVSGTARATTSGSTSTPSQSSGALAQGQTGGLAAPRFLPRTGGADTAVIWLFGIGLTLVAAGWMARRKLN